MLHVVLLLMECQFSGNMTNIPAVLQPASTCQWFRLLAVCCQRFTHQPIVFLHCEANAYFIGSGCAGSLFSSSGAAALVCCVSWHALSRSWLAEEKKKETSRSLLARWRISHKHHGEISAISARWRISRHDLAEI